MIDVIDGRKIALNWSFISWMMAFLSSLSKIFFVILKNSQGSTGMHVSLRRKGLNGTKGLLNFFVIELDMMMIVDYYDADLKCY